MSTQKQIDASRANGAKSNGPKTPEGQQTSSRNNTRHGLLSRTIVLEGESLERFTELHESLILEHKPNTPPN